MSSSPQYLIIVRHGRSRANEVMSSALPDVQRFDLTGTDEEIPLIDEGAKQCRNLGVLIGLLFNSDNPIEQILESPFLRARQSTDQIASQLPYHCKRSVDNRLTKRSHGIFWNLSYLGVKTLHPEEFERYQTQGPLAYRPPEGENYLDVYERIDNFIDEVIEPSTGNLLLVTHSAVVLSFQRRFECISDEEVLDRYENQILPNAAAFIYMRESIGQPWKRLLIGHELALIADWNEEPSK